MWAGRAGPRRRRLGNPVHVENPARSLRAARSVPAERQLVAPIRGASDAPRHPRGAARRDAGRGRDRSAGPACTAISATGNLRRRWPPPTSTARSPRSSGPTTPAGSPTPGSRSSRRYTEEDLPESLHERLGEPGEYPYTRGVHARHVPQAAVDDAPVRRLRERQGVQRALPLPARARLDRAEHGVRPADPARPGLRRPALPRRGRPHRRRDRHDRRHADRVRWDPARPGVDVDDDQRPGGRAAAALRAGRPRSRASPPSSCAGRPRTTSSRSTSRAGTSSTRPRARSG